MHCLFEVCVEEQYLGEIGGRATDCSSVGRANDSRAHPSALIIDQLHVVVGRTDE